MLLFVAAVAVAVVLSDIVAVVADAVAGAITVFVAVCSFIVVASVFIRCCFGCG